MSNNKWVPTDEVTSEQMFEWQQEHRARQKEKYEASQRKLKVSNDWKDFIFPCIERSYLGAVKMDDGVNISDVQEGIWAHGYRMVYWRVSREIVSIEKKLKQKG